MTKRNSTPPEAVLVAIDMAKHRQEILLERPEGGRRRRMTVMATKADYDRLADELTAIGRPVIVGFEATGNYHSTLAHRRSEEPTSALQSLMRYSYAVFCLKKQNQNKHE